MSFKMYTLFVTLCAMLIFTAFSQNKPTDIGVSADGAILMEQESGRVLFEKNPHNVRRIASITKIMTAILAIESGKLDDTVKVGKTAAYAEGSSIYLQPGERIKLEDLVYGLMLRSGNDAANAIAEHVGGSVEGFVLLMNLKAKEIGMTHTVFSNPSGLDTHEEHYSTPYDMALLTRYAMKNETFRNISGTKIYTFEREEGRQSWKNKNRLLTEKYKYATGGKTGFTKRAGRTLVTTAAKDGVELIAVTLNAPDDWNDHISMFEAGFRNYEMKKIVSRGILSDVQPVQGKKLYIKQDVYYPVADGEESDFRIQYRLIPPKELSKTQAGEVGKALVYFQENVIRQVPVFVKEVQTKEKEPWWGKFKSFIFGQAGGIAHD